MKERLKQLLYIITKYEVSDVHFILMNDDLKVQIRGIDGLQDIHNAAFDVALFQYLKYISNLDLGNGNEAQSGSFSHKFQDTLFHFRFSLLRTLDRETGVLRVLKNDNSFTIEELTDNLKQRNSFYSWCHRRSGLVILSGPTGSGKTTTLHAILKQIAKDQNLQVVSLEDPIEIIDNSYLQLQINNKNNFTYEEGIKHLLRHDPDVIMIGEIRDAKTAKTLLRCALSGHMIFTTIHAKCCLEALKRLHEFGLRNNELEHTLTAICSQRLYAKKNGTGRICIYEILEKAELSYYFSQNKLQKTHIDIFKNIENAVFQGNIHEKEAKLDLTS